MRKCNLIFVDNEFLAWIDTNVGFLFDEFTCINYVGERIKLLNCSLSTIRYVTNFYYFKEDHLRTLVHYLNSAFAFSFQDSIKDIITFCADFEGLERYRYIHDHNRVND